MLGFDATTHTYYLDDEQIPCVSDIIAPVQEDSMASIPPDVLANAARRGTEVHELTQAIDYGLELEGEEVQDDLKPYVDAYVKFLLDHDEIKWDGVESMVCSTHTPVTYAGTVDRWMYRDGQLTILDIKTVQTATPLQKLSLCLQTKAYELAIREWHHIPQDAICKRYGLYLLKDGKYRLFDCETFEEKDGIDPARILSWLMRLWAEKQEFKDWLREIQNKHKRRKKND